MAGLFEVPIGNLEMAEGFGGLQGRFVEMAGVFGIFEPRITRNTRICGKQLDQRS